MDRPTARRGLHAAILLLLAFALLPAAARAADCTTPRWIPSWSTSMSDAATGGFDGQTVREIITPHVAGTSVRLHLSNRFGAQSVTFDHVTLGRRLAGAAVIASTLRPVTFGGEVSVAVAPGTEAISDPIAIRFSAFQQLTVSLFFADGTGPATEHFVGRHPAYATLPGGGVDATGDAAEGAFDELDSTATFFASQLDVLAPASTGVVVALGDSITDGYAGSPSPLAINREPIDADGAYPDVLQRRVLLGRGPAFAIVNAGITGNRILEDGLIAVHGPSALSRLRSDALALAGVTTVIILLGANDLGDRTAQSAQVIAGLKDLVAGVRAAGKRVLVGTMTPMVGALSETYGDAQAQTNREQVNAWIRSPGAADGVIDFDAVLTDPGDPGRLRSAYDSGDGLHPNLAGYRVMADAVALTLLKAQPQLRPSLKVTVPARYRSRLRSAVVTIDGRRVGAIRTPRGSVWVDFAMGRRAVATVRTRITLSGGRTVGLSRRIARCVG
jgi:lysophospholipase L1-like esterase